MANYRIHFRKSAAKELGKLPKAALRSVIRRIESLAEEPRPQGVEKLTGHELYRIRQGDYRIVYSIKDSELPIWIIKIGHHKGIYKSLQRDDIWG